VDTRSAERLERLRRAAECGDARAAADLVRNRLARRGRARLAVARRHAELAIGHPEPDEASRVAGLFLWADGCNGASRPADPGADPALGLWLLRRLARQGNGHAAYSLSLAYEHGVGVERNIDTAVRWARRAARLGETEARNNLGVALFYGKGVERDERRAARCYREAAAHGDAHAAANLARCHRWGDGVRKDKREALRLHRLAARRCHTSSQLQVAEAYLDGDLGRRDRRRGQRMLRQLARSGNRSAMVELAERQIDGKGVARNPVAGLELVRALVRKQKPSPYAPRSPRYRYVPALITLGNHFHDLGASAPRHFATAMTWYRRAAEAGEARGWRNMANCLLAGHPPVVRKDVQRGLRCLRRAVELGDEDAMSDLGERLLDGDGLRRDRRRGLALLERAAIEGCRAAAGILAARYRDGRGLPRDARRSRAWARLAARWEVEVPPSSGGAPA
jgi:TPR repeat protein